MRKNKYKKMSNLIILNYDLHFLLILILSMRRVVISGMGMVSPLANNLT